MGETETSWTPGLVVLGVGLVVGAFLALRARANTRKGAKIAGKGKGNKAQPQATESIELRDARAMRDTRLEQLRELAVTRHKLAPGVARGEQLRLEREAAEAWRKLDKFSKAEHKKPEKKGEGAAAPSAVDEATPTPGLFARYPAVIGLVAGLIGAGFVFALKSGLESSSSARGGGSMTGGTAAMGGPPPGAGAMGGGAMAGGASPADADPEVRALRELVAANPTSIVAKLDLSQALLYRDDYMGSFSTAKEVLAVEPENARALTYSAVVRLAMGQGEGALKLLDTAVAKDPQLLEAHVHRGITAYQLGKWQTAVESWDTALKMAPEGKESIGHLLEDARSRAAGGPGTIERPPPGSTPPPHPPGGAPPPPPAQGMGGPPPMAMGAPPPPVDPANLPPETIRGTVSIDPGLAARAPPGAIVFVYVRPDGVSAGPPTAAKRFPVATLPASFALGPQDIMIQGMPWPDKVQLDARLDADGVATTKDPGDPTARLTGIGPGTGGLLLELK